MLHGQGSRNSRWPKMVDRTSIDGLIANSKLLLLLVVTSYIIQKVFLNVLSIVSGIIYYNTKKADLENSSTVHSVIQCIILL